MERSKIPAISAQREAPFTRLYLQTFPAVAKYIAKRGGSVDDAKDVFQDALIIYYEKFLSKGIKAENEAAYLMGTARHLWLRKFNIHNKIDTLTNENIDFAEDPDKQLSSNTILNYLEKAGQKCLKLLKAFYYDNMPLQDVAERFGFSGVRSATVQKYKCLEKVRDTVKQKQLHYEDFVE